MKWTPQTMGRKGGSQTSKRKTLAARANARLRWEKQSPNSYKLIYGLFDDSGICLYVGSSVDPRDRFYCMRSKHPEITEWKTIRKCRFSDAAEVEGQIIRAYKAKGQCQLNRETFGKNSKRFVNC